MKNRKFSSHFILKPDGTLGRWPVIEFSDKGEVLSVLYDSENLIEQPSMEFYGGLLLPGFIDVSVGITLDEKSLNRHYIAGTFIICDTKNISHQSFKQKHPPYIYSSSSSEHNDYFDDEHSCPLFERIKKMLSANNQLSLIELLHQATEVNAERVGISHLAGSLTKGLYPGLLVMENIDLTTFEFTQKTRVRWLCNQLGIRK